MAEYAKQHFSMKIFFWNVRGVKKDVERHKIRQYYLKFGFDVWVIVEPKIASRQNIVMKLGLGDFEDQITHNGDSEVKANIWIIRKRVVVTMIQST